MHSEISGGSDSPQAQSVWPSLQATRLVHCGVGGDRLTEHGPTSVGVPTTHSIH